MVVMTAGLLALNALAIDIMLPALGLIARDLSLNDPNDQQLVVVAYVLGFGAPQMLFGPISDRFGRRPVVFFCLTGYAIAGAACAAAPSFAMLLAMRFTQGVFASGCRVVAIAVVRDLYAGRVMARTMSLVMTVFMVVPILAPAIGQLILSMAPWRWTFGVLVIFSAAMLVWTIGRMPESLPEEERSELSLRGAARSYMGVLRERQTLGYMLASGFAFGSLFTFISSAEQIFREVFQQGERFALWFACVAGTLTVANFTNSRLVERFGMRRLSHGALVGFVTFSIVLLLLMRAGFGFAVFLPMFAIIFGFFGLIGANFNALAMDPLGRIAGTGAAAYGFMTTSVSGVLGGLAARYYDGTTTPLLIAFTALGCSSLAVVMITERGRLFHEPATAAA